MRWLCRARDSVALALLLGACGAGGQPASAPGTQSAGSEDDSASNESAVSAAEAERGPRLPSCSDGSCARCGETVCLKGFYCDENAPAGPSCSWLVECAAEPSCGCVTAALGSGCQCEQQGEVPRVRCSQ